MKTIVVGAQHRRLVRAAAARAHAERAELVVVDVDAATDPREVFDPGGASGTIPLARELRRFPEVGVRVRREPGDPAAAICRAARAESADLILVGRTRPRRSTGATDRIRRWAHCPVETVESGVRT